MLWPTLFVLQMHQPFYSCLRCKVGTGKPGKGIWKLRKGVVAHSFKCHSSGKKLTTRNALPPSRRLKVLRKLNASNYRLTQHVAMQLLNSASINFLQHPIHACFSVWQQRLKLKNCCHKSCQQ